MRDIEYRVAGEDCGLYIKEILSRRFKISSRLMRKLKVSGGVFLNGRPASLKQRPLEGDVLAVDYPGESSYFPPQDIPVEAVYEDGDMLIVNKQPGLVVHPTKNYLDGTLANALAFRLLQERVDYKIRFVNRLDRDTSGLLVVAKNAHCQSFLMGEMERGRMVKKYLAIVHGTLDGEGCVNAPIGKDDSHKARRVVREDGFSSVTRYKALKHFPASFGSVGGFTLAELSLETGRTHQIRVHMAHMGCPIAGDELYGELFGYEAGKDVIKRQALHAFSLEFTGPGGNSIKVSSPMPGDMEDCIRTIESMERRQAADADLLKTRKV